MVWRDHDPGAELADEGLFRELYRPLRRFAAACAPSGVDPDDLVQEAVARTLRLHALSDLDDAGAYLRTAIANLARDRYRAKTVTAVPGEASASDSYPSDLAAMDQLSVDDRAALFLVDVERIPFKAGAALLGCSPAALKARTIRARRRLRRALEEGDQRHG